MAKKSKDVICTSECSECVHSNLDVKNITLKFVYGTSTSKNTLK